MCPVPGMTVARRLLPGTTHAVTRRCVGRQFLLKPVRRVTEILGYTLGLALSRSEGVRLHALFVESSHHHALLTDDPDQAQLPDVFRTFHSLSARAINCHWGRGESLWRDRGYSNVEIHDDPSGLEDGEALVWTLEEQLLYVWTQPVRDGLVERPEDWVGLKFLPEDFGTEVTFAKPAGAFFG